MNLAQIQARFSDQLLNPTDAYEALQLDGPFAIEHLLQLYRNNFYISFTEYLEACFPTLKALVGDEFFQQLAKHFIKEKPLSEGSIERYGALLADYIQHCPQTQTLPYLADICRLEWCLEQAKSQLPDTVFPFNELGSLSEEEQEHVCFKLATGIEIIHSPFPIFSIWKGVKHEELDHIDISACESVLIYPTVSKEHESAGMIMTSPSQNILLLALQANTPLRLLEVDSEIQQQLTLWINLGVISNFCLESPQ